MAIGPFLAKIQQSPYLNLKIQGQGQIRWAHSGPRVQSICLLFVSWQSGHLWLCYSKFHIWLWKVKVMVMAKVKSDGHNQRMEFTRYVCFRLVAIVPFLAEIKQIPHLILKIQGQGHDENRPKSNQVIYRSGSLILPKLKKSEKLFRSYRVNKSLRCWWCRTNWYKNIITPGIPMWLN